MKKILTTIAFMTTFATASFADNFNNTSFGMNIVSGPADVLIDGTEHQFTNLEVGVTMLPYAIGSADADLRFALGSNLDTDDVYLLGEHNVTYRVTSDLSLYGTTAVAYDTDTRFNSDQWFLSPYAGVNYNVYKGVSVYGETGYTWGMSNDFSGAGGYVEAGVPFALNETYTLTPSITRTFDTMNDETNFRLETTIRF